MTASTRGGGLDGPPHIDQATLVGDAVVRRVQAFAGDPPSPGATRLRTRRSGNRVRDGAMPSRRGGPDSPRMIGHDPVGGDQRVAVPPPLHDGGLEPGLAQLGVVHDDDLERTLRLLDAVGKPAEQSPHRRPVGVLQMSSDPPASLATG